MGDVDIEAYNREQAEKAAQRKQAEAEAVREEKRIARALRLEEKKRNQGKAVVEDDAELGEAAGPAGPTMKERLTACIKMLCVVCRLLLKYARYALKKCAPTTRWLIVEHPLKFWGICLVFISFAMVTIRWTETSIVLFLAIIFSLILVLGTPVPAHALTVRARALSPPPALTTHQATGLPR